MKFRTVAIAARTEAQLDKAVSALTQWNNVMQTDSDNHPIVGIPPNRNWDVPQCRGYLIVAAVVNDSLSESISSVAHAAYWLRNPAGLPRSADNWLIVTDRIAGAFSEGCGAENFGIALVPANPTVCSAPMWALVGHELAHDDNVQGNSHDPSHLSASDDYVLFNQYLHQIMNKDVGSTGIGHLGNIPESRSPWWP